MYNNPYVQNYASYGQQSLNERIDSQIAQLNQMKEQLKNNQQPAINQTFQLAPTNHSMKYANTIDEVSKENIYNDTPFFSRDMSVVWIKNSKGEIKTYELKEIIKKDEKDIQIEMLQTQINEMRRMMENAKSDNEYTDDTIEDEKPTNVSIHRTGTKKQK